MVMRFRYRAESRKIGVTALGRGRAFRSAAKRNFGAQLVTRSLGRGVFISFKFRFLGTDRYVSTLPFGQLGPSPGPVPQVLIARGKRASHRRVRGPSPPGVAFYRFLSGSRTC